MAKSRIRRFKEGDGVDTNFGPARVTGIRDGGEVVDVVGQDGQKRTIRQGEPASGTIKKRRR